MYATKAEKTQVPLSMLWLKISSSMKSALSRGSRAARGVWRRNVTRYLVGPQKTARRWAESEPIYTQQSGFDFR